ncbi:uncharacterized protein B0H18DRAFT_883034 [Fomitopsis serialis]|uniref:uncharacterized protein n=1 Tax=Fomitopsis serialis TaxID=139415 RepID=UPI002007DEAC|nr:uncharacterized protein B0H18DRAFT_883034 [Neoantrodia serialis]KAH9918137.1 hypothetical protein B0H18DRAFT_883034 [Neoantrodia serialis]
MPAARRRSIKTSSSSGSQPDRVFTDVVLTIKSEYVVLIRERRKNHEFRSYKLRPSVQRLWLYESAPRCAIQYVSTDRGPKVPGELRDPSGVKNDDFDAGLMTAYAYPVRALYKLDAPVTREELNNRFAVKSPQGFCYATRPMVESMPLEGMEQVF